ncbi:MAG: HD domain-containing protein, partial [Planctomycetota bacterium]
LTAEEFDIIKKHPEMGYEILKPIRSFEHILDGVLYHHENPDGSGYPHGLRGDEIPLFARIIHVVDVFDALSSQRSYRDAFTVDRAIRIIREEAGDKLDAEIAEVFLREIANFREEQADAFEAMFPSAKREVDA